MFMDMTGKVALISGSAQGLAAAAAEVLVRHGAKVLLADAANEGDAVQTSAERSGSVAYARLDVTRMSDWQRVVAFAEERFGRLTTLINHAASSGRPWDDAPSEEDWQKTIDLDLKSSFLGIKACVPAMRRAGGGAIVNTSSTYGIVVSGCGGSAYSSAMGGLVMLSKAAAVEYARDNIRVNCIHPGIMNTPEHRPLPPDRLKDVVERTPLRRMADPTEIANAVLFLASDAASYMTGSSLVVDGGYVIL
jgi:NAD(P)-dependent dehydrogenase (short-subunit alcohol dehydrogenase family)